jgi:uncharacterized membrane protein YfcA
MPDYAISLSGFFVGVIVGLTGVGGGSLMTPLLLLVFGVPAQTAVGTDLLYASITKSAGAFAHWSNKNIDWQVVRRLSYGSIPAALAMLTLLHSNVISGVEDRFIVVAVGWALIVTGVAQIAKPLLHRVGQRFRSVRPARFRSLQPPLTVIGGAIIGALVALTSIGAGALGAVMLLYLYPYRLTPVRLVATDIAHAIPLALVAGAGHLALGNIDFPLLGLLLIGSIPGIVLGAHLATRSPERLLRGALAVILAFVGIRLIS